MALSHQRHCMDTLPFTDIKEQGSRADARVSERQSRHLAINCEFGFINSDSNSLTCVATWRKH